MPPCDLAERETGWRPTVYPNILYLSSLCPLSASIGSIYCRPERARPSGSTVVKCLRAHQCLTSETLLSNLQSDGGRPTSSLGSLDRPPGTARRQYHSSPASPFWTFRTCQVFFFRPSVITPPSQHVGKTRSSFLSFLSLVYGGFEGFRPTFGLTTYV